MAPIHNQLANWCAEERNTTPCFLLRRTCEISQGSFRVHCQELFLPRSSEAQTWQDGIGTLPCMCGGSPRSLCIAYLQKRWYFIFRQLNMGSVPTMWLCALTNLIKVTALLMNIDFDAALFSNLIFTRATKMSAASNFLEHLLKLTEKDRNSQMWATAFQQEVCCRNLYKKVIFLSLSLFLSVCD